MEPGGGLERAPGGRAALQVGVDALLRLLVPNSCADSSTSPALLQATATGLTAPSGLSA